MLQMPRLAILNMLIGFAVLTLAASAGAFIALDTTDAFLKDKAILDSWQMILQRSSHGHTNLFGLLHIAFGLTLPYSAWSLGVKKWQTVGLFLGTVAMGPVMIARSFMGPTSTLDGPEILMGVLLSAAFLTLLSHSAGLAKKLFSRV
jgi:hypothetical protein